MMGVVGGRQDRAKAFFRMKNYVLISGIVFCLVVIAHVARVLAEGAELLKEPAFLFTSLLSIALAVWAWRLFRQLAGSDEGR